MDSRIDSFPNNSSESFKEENDKEVYQSTRKRDLKHEKRIDSNVNGRWNKEEQNQFLKACYINGNDWKKFKKYISTRCNSQIRSHAQKYIGRIERKYPSDNKKINEAINEAISKGQLLDFIEKYQESHLPPYDLQEQKMIDLTILTKFKLAILKKNSFSKTCITLINQQEYQKKEIIKKKKFNIKKKLCVKPSTNHPNANKSNTFFQQNKPINEPEEHHSCLNLNASQEYMKLVDYIKNRTFHPNININTQPQIQFNQPNFIFSQANLPMNYYNIQSFYYNNPNYNNGSMNPSLYNYYPPQQQYQFQLLPQPLPFQSYPSSIDHFINNYFPSSSGNQTNNNAFGKHS